MRDVHYYDFEIFRLDVENEQLLKSNQPIPLTRKAFKTLLILVQNYGHLVKKEDIITKIWHDSFVEESNLTQHIYVLRKTLGNNTEGKPFIETIPKSGYCFNADVKEVKVIENFVKSDSISGRLYQDDSVLNEEILFVKDEPNKSIVIGKNSDFHISEDSSDNQSSQKTKIVGLKFRSLLMVLAVLLVMSIFLYRPLQNYLFPPNENIKSIAILPFKPIGEESSDAKLGFGMADSVITRLSKLQKIRVRPTSASFRYVDVAVDPIVAGKELGVDAVLEGTVQMDGEWVRVSVRLIKVSDGKTLWADTFDQEFTHIFALQDSISTKVAKALSFNLSSKQEEQIVARNTLNTEAYQAYQLGIYFWNKRAKEDLEKASDYFQKAVQIDENYALAFAMLADSYNMLHYYQLTDNSKETIDKADEAAKKALLLNDSLAESQIAMAYVQIAKYRDHDSSIGYLKRAIEISPDNSTARIRYGWQLLRLQDLEGTLEQMRIAQENDPLSQVSNSALCSVLLLKRNYSEALKYCERAVELQSNSPLIRVQLASVYFLNGKIEEAVTILQEEGKNPRHKYDALAGLAYIYAKTGKNKEAEEIFAKLKNEIKIYNKYSDLTLLAFTLGKKEEALEYFKIMIARRKILSLDVLSDPYWEDVFKDKDFRQLANLPNQ